MCALLELYEAIQLAKGDFEPHGDIDIADLSNFLSHWLDSGCYENNNWCSGCDLDQSGDVDLVDFAVLAKNSGSAG